MQDVNIMLSNSEHEQTDVDLDDAQCNVHAGADSDHDRDCDTGVNDSELEDDDLDAAARMLSDEVIQTAISEVKCHVMFVHGYPELVEKNQLSTQTLLTIAEKHSMGAIKEHLQVDKLYALQLGALVDAHIPIMRCKLKDDACTNVDGYFCLGHKDFAKAKNLMEKLVYIYTMKFNVNNNAMPIRNRPYQGELLILLISNQLFHSLRAIGVKFASCFVEITKNKLKHPEIPIPLLALVVTAVYSALLWKSLSSPGKFNFSGNQLSEIYSYHVKSLEQLKHDAPGKFHYIMADIYEAAQ
ncbi:hypothetical protein BDR06DRAFT_1011463 [Suillus hirtellus]|nr:hypothetical protein BDR06DRAFT_1011463 [Suillus hirtellus]